jgi:predicted component of type VI protein secretion system
VYGSEVIVRERGSKNGTFVNGVRVEAQSGIRHGESVRFGKVEARVEISDSESDLSTAATAFYDHRKYMHEAEEPKPPETQFPVVFEPGGARRNL